MEQGNGVFDVSNDDTHDTDDDDDQVASMNCKRSAVGAVAVGEKNVLQYKSMTPMGGGSDAPTGPNNDDADNVAGETTSLLGNGSATSSMGAMNNFG